MDKQLLEQEAKMWVSENWKPTRVAAYIAGATSSSTVKELEREVERSKGLYPIAFIQWYSGMEIKKIETAFRRWHRETEEGFKFKTENNL